MAALMLPHLPPALRDPLLSVALSVGFPADQLLFVSIGFVSVFLGFLHARIPFKYTTTRHVFSIALGLLWGYLINGPEMIYALVVPVVVYAIVSLAPSALSPLISSVFALGCLSFCHIYRMITEYMVWRLDYTGPLMISTVKSITFAFACADGQRLSKGKMLNEKQHIHDELKVKAIPKKPSFFHYMSYICFYGGITAGPAFEIKHYLAFQDGTLFTEKGFNSTPSTVGSTFRAFLRVLICAPLLVASGSFPVGGYLGTPEYTSRGLVYKVLYLWFAVTLSRFKYYFAWYMIELACISCGLGFDPVKSHDKKLDFSALNNVECLKVEMNSNIVEMINSWNKGVNQWLKDCTPSSNHESVQYL
eukprot:TRINITY_DN2551_c0_g1_i1.p1 TRINITY_DN2551_c0_g1~~TRINITY_DN2551_c0_g1_i1.p1  ORF type:complete len:376 (+),score=79.20 TRINITY_DN2551_c0_g1_i1:43-1128(+)